MQRDKYQNKVSKESVQGVQTRCPRKVSKVPNMLTWFERAYASAASQTEITALERSCGLITGEEYAEIYRKCLSEQIRPRFARRGITLS